MIARALALIALAAAVCCGESLFDGKTLKGWHVSAKPADAAKTFWQVRDGAITCDSLGRKDHDYVWLVSDGEYAGFDLRLKVRGFPQSPGNSGVQVRSRYDDAAFWMDGPQIDVHPPAPWRTGLIYDETRGVQHWIFPTLPDWNIAPAQGPARWDWREDAWNDLQIVCRGTRITTKLNALPAADFDGRGVLDDATHRKHNVGLKGHIAFQLHSSDELLISYKDIEITTFP
ncbi:MAG: DUF1080 domain-containing protein [Acidobacteriota bacterium]